MAVTIVRTTCDRCGDLELTPSQLELVMRRDAAATTYRFRCPICSEAVHKDAGDSRVVQLLVSAGVKVLVWDFPAELGESREGPPLTSDDLIDFHLELETDDWFERLQSTSTPS